jgi:hypothetical protein
MIRTSPLPVRARSGFLVLLVVSIVFAQTSEVAKPLLPLFFVGQVMQGFQEVCTIETDISFLRGILKKKTKPGRGCCDKDRSHWTLEYSIALTFGSTELKAFVIWEDKVRKYRLHFMPSPC